MSVLVLLGRRPRDPAHEEEEGEEEGEGGQHGGPEVHEAPPLAGRRAVCRLTLLCLIFLFLGNNDFKKVRGKKIGFFYFAWSICSYTSFPILMGTGE